MSKPGFLNWLELAKIQPTDMYVTIKPLVSEQLMEIGKVQTLLNSHHAYSDPTWYLSSTVRGVAWTDGDFIKDSPVHISIPLIKILHFFGTVL